MSGRFIGREEAAQLIGITVRQLHRMDEEADPPPWSGRGYECKQFGRWLRRQFRREAGITEDGQVYDYEQERILLAGFIKGLENETLRELLERNFSGRSTYGRLDDILAFYPDEQEQWAAYRENQLTSRIKTWLEEHDIYPTDYSH